MIAPRARLSLPGAFVAAFLVSVVVALVIAGLVLAILGPTGEPPVAFGSRWAGTYMALAFAGVRWLIATRRSANPIGWVLLVTGVWLGINMAEVKPAADRWATATAEEMPELLLEAQNAWIQTMDVFRVWAVLFGLGFVVFGIARLLCANRLAMGWLAVVGE